MKKLSLYFAFLLVLVTSCMKDELYEPVPYKVTEDLAIDDISGIRLQSYVVEEEVSMNIKLPVTGSYRIKILDITNTTISQEIIEGTTGDNILKLYVKALPVSSYTILVTDMNDNYIGRDLFSKI